MRGTNYDQGRPLAQSASEVLTARGWKYQDGVGKGLDGAIDIVDTTTGKVLHTCHATSRHRALNDADSWVVVAGDADDLVDEADVRRVTTLWRAQRAVMRACDTLGEAGGLLDEAGSYDLRERCSDIVRSLEGMRDTISARRSGPREHPAD